MNATDGVVERVEGDFAWVRAMGPGGACGACSQKTGCSSFRLEHVLSSSAQGQLLKLPNGIHARPGDRVIIHAADGMVWHAVWRAYVLPLLLSLGGVLLAKALCTNEGLTVLGAALGLTVGFFALYRHQLDSRNREPIFSIEFKNAS